LLNTSNDFSVLITFNLS